MAIVRTTSNRQLVLAVSDAAAGHGVRPGMTLAQARALCAHIEPIEHQPHRDAMALEALARWMMRFSPCVALHTVRTAGENPDQGTSAGRIKPTISLGSHAGLHPDLCSRGGQEQAIWLDLSGTERLFGPPQNVAGQIESALRRWQISARLAISHSPGAAWAMTYRPLPIAGGQPCAFASRGASAAGEGQFDDLPIVSLRLPVDVVAMLHHLGIFHIGQLRKLPRQQLPARFGSILLTRLDQLDGRTEEPLVPIEPVWPVVAHRRWEEPVENLEWIWSIAQELIEQVTDRLLRRGHGAREISAMLTPAQGRPIQRTLRFARPTRDPRRIFRQLREVLEQPTSNTSSRRAAPGRAGSRSFPLVASPERGAGRWLFPSVASALPADLSAFDSNGFVALRLEVLQSQRMATEQIGLGGSDLFEDQRQLEDLVERICARLGDSAIVQVRLVESHVPERAYEPITGSHRQTEAASSLPCATLSPGISPAPPPPRPLHLHEPLEIRVMVSPSHDRDGRPVSLTDPAGRVHRIIHAVGPERIGGEWWIGHHKSRDYFDVELPDGRRWWVFRVNETGRWFWHGEF
ncbi:MAG: DNA polymerase Y family protein [Phycisphaerae bacterium]|nr:DNA polymerase Y family protein [Phycisphaerae bacterium]MDW8261670.1 DNA polymerase Y family protein [Phycisphaerales bacterium]